MKITAYGGEEPGDHRSLQQLASLRPGTRVVLELPSSAHLAWALLECWKQGLVAVPMDPAWSGKRQLHIQQHSRAPVTYSGNGLEHLYPDGHEDGEEQWEPSPVGHAFLMYTSGSTGDPKGVILTRKMVEANALATAAIHGFNSFDQHGTCLSLHHCNALIMSLFGCYFTGTELTIWTGRRFDPKEVWQIIEEMGIRTFNIVPALLHHWIKNTPREWPTSLNHFITAAAPLSSRLATEFYEKHGPCRLFQGYGMTEATNFSFMDAPHSNEAQWEKDYLNPDLPPTVGTHIHDDEQYCLSDGEVLLVTGAHHTTPGYWRNEEATQALFGGVRSGGSGFHLRLHTGDFGAVHNSKLYLLGRTKECINRGGETIWPKDLEEQYELTEPIIVVPVATGDYLTEEPGVAGTLLGGNEFAACTEEPCPRTDTHKPKRLVAGARMPAMTLPGDEYKRLQAFAYRAAQAICEYASKQGVQPATQPLKLHDTAKYIMEKHPQWGGLQVKAESPLEVWALMMAEATPGLLAGTLSGEELVRQNHGLWKAMMTASPMGLYARMVDRLLRARGMVGGDAKGYILELGAGVGNTTDLVTKDAPFWVPTDLHGKGEFKRITDGPMSGRLVTTGVSRFNFDSEEDWAQIPDGVFDAVVATNALHCSSDPEDVLAQARQSLKPGGICVLAEGAPVVYEREPWAGDILFQPFGGWWDRGGFRSRRDWLVMLRAAGFKHRGFSKLRMGKYDLGGLVWGIA